MDLPTITEIAQPHARADLPGWSAGDAWLAGGTWLFSEPQPGLSRLVDLAELRWPALEISEQGLRIAATCTLARLAQIDPLPSWRAAPLFGQCCRALLGSFKIWNAATVGGNLCMALPAGPMAALSVALHGICTIWTQDGGQRQLPVGDLIVGPNRTSLAPGELLRAVDLPAESLRRPTAFRQTSLTPAGRSGALLVGTLRASGGFELTVTAATRRPVLIGFDAMPTAIGLAAAVREMIPDDLYYDDCHGAPAWRRAMTFRFAEQIRAELAALA